VTNAQERKGESSPQLEEVLRFRFPERREIEAYAIELETGEIIVRGKDELEKISPAPKEKEKKEKKGEPT